MHEVVQLLLHELQLRVETAVLAAVLLDLLLDLFGSLFEVIHVVKVHTHSKGRQVHVVNTGLEFSSSDFSVLLDWFPDEIGVILHDLRNQLLS